MYTLVPASPRAALPTATIRQNSKPTITTRILSVLVAHRVISMGYGALTSALCSGVKMLCRGSATAVRCITSHGQTPDRRSTIKGLGMGDRRDGVSAPYRDTRIAGTARH